MGCCFQSLFPGPEGRLFPRRTISVVSFLFCCALTGCLTTPNPPAQVSGANAIQFAAEHRDQLWEQAVRVLNRHHFQIARESKLEGVIETRPRTGANLLEWWHPDSVGFENRLESTLQSVRRRVVVSVRPSGDGLMMVAVNVFKEIEDFPGQSAGRHSLTPHSDSEVIDRDYADGFGQDSPSRWIPLGRDQLLEQQLLAQIRTPAF